MQASLHAPLLLRVNGLGILSQRTAARACSNFVLDLLLLLVTNYLANKPDRRLACGTRHKFVRPSGRPGPGRPTYEVRAKCFLFDCGPCGSRKFFLLCESRFKNFSIVRNEASKSNRHAPLRAQALTSCHRYRDQSHFSHLHFIAKDFLRCDECCFTLSCSNFPYGDKILQDRR